MTPKKFYRYVIKGIYFYCGKNKNGCTVNELTSYVYLKNQRSNKIDFIEKIVQLVTAQLRSQALVTESSNGRLILNELLFNESLADKPQNSRDNSDDSSDESSASGTSSSQSSIGSSRTQSLQSIDNASKFGRDEKFRLDPNQQNPSKRKSLSSSEDEPPPKSLSNRKGKFTTLPRYRKH
ncbi:uncharacterized protein LOC131433076 [Malaya genurostris]|uniref:uncharacterized protein LOC131433076 n=1 Tax=Malaya genurostris TaxID=325434 RepID=UPI0026F3ACCD|nr:uncharacterized protein LOC131433076 [Malaya genurostris]